MTRDLLEIEHRRASNGYEANETTSSHRRIMEAYVLSLGQIGSKRPRDVSVLFLGVTFSILLVKLGFFELKKGMSKSRSLSQYRARFIQFTEDMCALGLVHFLTNICQIGFRAMGGAENTFETDLIFDVALLFSVALIVFQIASFFLILLARFISMRSLHRKLRTTLRDAELDLSDIEIDIENTSGFQRLMLIKQRWEIRERISYTRLKEEFKSGQAIEREEEFFEYISQGGVKTSNEIHEMHFSLWIILFFVFTLCLLNISRSSEGTEIGPNSRIQLTILFLGWLPVVSHFTLLVAMQLKIKDFLEEIKMRGEAAYDRISPRNPNYFFVFSSRKANFFVLKGLLLTEYFYTTAMLVGGAYYFAAYFPINISVIVEILALAPVLLSTFILGPSSLAIFVLLQYCSDEADGEILSRISADGQNLNRSSGGPLNINPLGNDVLNILPSSSSPSPHSRLMTNLAVVSADENEFSSEVAAPASSDRQQGLPSPGERYATQNTSGLMSPVSGLLSPTSGLMSPTSGGQLLAISDAPTLDFKSHVSSIRRTVSERRRGAAERQTERYNERDTEIGTVIKVDLDDDARSESGVSPGVKNWNKLRTTFSTIRAIQPRPKNTDSTSASVASQHSPRNKHYPPPISLEREQDFCAMSDGQSSPGRDRWDKLKSNLSDVRHSLARNQNSHSLGKHIGRRPDENRPMEREMLDTSSDPGGSSGIQNWAKVRNTLATVRALQPRSKFLERQKLASVSTVLGSEQEERNGNEKRDLWEEIRSSILRTGAQNLRLVPASPSLEIGEHDEISQRLPHSNSTEESPRSMLKFSPANSVDVNWRPSGFTNTRTTPLPPKSSNMNGVISPGQLPANGLWGDQTVADALTALTAAIETVSVSNSNVQVQNRFLSIALDSTDARNECGEREDEPRHESSGEFQKDMLADKLGDDLGLVLVPKTATGRREQASADSPYRLVLDLDSPSMGNVLHSESPQSKIALTPPALDMDTIAARTFQKLPITESSPGGRPRPAPIKLENSDSVPARASPSSKSRQLGSPLQLKTSPKAVESELLLGADGGQEEEEGRKKGRQKKEVGGGGGSGKRRESASGPAAGGGGGGGIAAGGGAVRVLRVTKKNAGGERSDVT